MSNFLIHDLVQGSPEWLAYRMDHQNASDAAAMLNISKTTTRSELLRLYYTGDSKEFSDWVQRNILDYGHEVEDKVRPIVDEIIGQPLYPATISLGKLSASSDGMTMDDTIGFECKQYNAKLFAAIQDGELPDEYIPQIQQFFMINNKAVKVIFVCSDGTKENFASMEVLPDKEWFDTIARGWKQFETDLLNYQHVEAKPEAVGKVPESLPALRIEVTGMVTSSNLVVFKETAMAVTSMRSAGSDSGTLPTASGFASTC